jgi:cytochrome c5
VVLGLAGAALLSALPVLAALPASMGHQSALTGSGPAPTPTVDRLAAPPTVTNPTQADVGAQLFWLHCQPCHGDQAQGLTPDWRAQYPPDHQDCWKSRCHGDPPYQNGFILPHTVPALVGPGTLNHFATAADLYTFISHAMPFQAPGSLKPEEYWAIAAFLLRGHGLLAAALPINDPASAQRIPLGATAASPAAAMMPAEVTTATAATPGSPNGLPATPAVLVVAGLGVLGAGWLVWRGARHHG